MYKNCKASTSSDLDDDQSDQQSNLTFQTEYQKKCSSAVSKSVP